MNTILLIDDDSDYLDTTKIFLTSQGYQVITANNGEQGYKSAKIACPDLILLDVMMTTENEGLEIARRFGEDPATKKIPIIMITGIKSELMLPKEINPDSAWLPVKVILEKPVSLETLLKTVKMFLPPVS